MQTEKRQSAIYCRVAHADESAMEKQRRSMRQFAALKGYDVSDEYLDNGESGLTLNRPAFTRLNDDMLAGKIQTVLVVSVTRIADAYSNYIPTVCEDEKIQNFATKLTSRKRRETVLADARSIAPIGLDTFDKNKILLNCRNGTFNLNDMTFHSHNPADYVTKMTRVKYDPKARCARWERFVEEVMCGDKDAARYLQKVLGYACTGDTSLEKMWLLYGASTRNGKSTAMETVAYLLGDYAKTASAATISHRATDGSKASPDIARLMGTRLVNINEPDKDLILNAAIVKQLTGGDTLVARFLNENLFEFLPESKFFIKPKHNKAYNFFIV